MIVMYFLLFYENAESEFDLVVAEKLWQNASSIVDLMIDMYFVLWENCVCEFDPVFCRKNIASIVDLMIDM